MKRFFWLKDLMCMVETQFVGYSYQYSSNAPNHAGFRGDSTYQEDVVTRMKSWPGGSFEVSHQGAMEFYKLGIDPTECAEVEDLEEL